jgi:predicted dehydrogenase
MATAAEPLRIGILGAARIAERGITVAARNTGSRLVAIAARDTARAEGFARAHGVDRVSNAAEAAAVRDVAHRAGVTVMEGFHYLYHPVMRRLHELVEAGELGDLVHVEATIAMLPPEDGDPRWSLDLAGGALMDLGCYGVDALRSLAPWAGGDPVPGAARAGERAGSPGVDEWLNADLRFPSGATATVDCSMVHPGRDFSLRIVGTCGEATAPAFVELNRDDRVLVRSPAGAWTEHLGTRSSYTFSWRRSSLPSGTGRPSAPARTTPSRP